MLTVLYVFLLPYRFCCVCYYVHAFQLQTKVFNEQQYLFVTFTRSPFFSRQNPETMML